MASLPIVFPPPPWVNQDIVVYHGTVDVSARAIMSGPIKEGLGKPNTDFGPGFYTTTLRRQAHMWAAQISATRPDADDYWSLIYHCRKDALSHAPGSTPF